MKHRILTLLAVLMSLCLFIELAPPSLTGRNSFYFRRGQWLADARTILEGIRFLCDSGTANQTNPMVIASTPHSRPLRPPLSTNFIGIERTDDKAAG